MATGACRCCRHVLHELDGVTVGILHHETAVAVQILIDLSRYLDSLACEEIAQLTRVGGLEADTDQAILIAFEGGRDLDGLAVIDLEADKIAWNLGSLVENTSSIPTTPC